jgi:hypothetical protein
MNKKLLIRSTVLGVMVMVALLLLIVHVVISKKTHLYCAYSTQDGFWNFHKEVLIKRGETLDIGVGLSERNGLPLEGKLVSFIQWRNGFFFSSSLTSASGVASVSYPASIDAELNSVSRIFVFYAGNFVYQSHFCVVPVKVVNERFEYATTAPEGKSVHQNIAAGYVVYPPIGWGVAHRANYTNINFGPGVSSDHGLGGIEVFEDPKFVSADDFFNHLSRADGTYINLRPTVVDGYKAVRYDRKDLALGQGVVTLKGNRLYHLYIQSQNKEDLEKFDYMVASLNFSEPLHK